MRKLKNYLKFSIKWKIAKPIRTLLAFIFGHKPNISSWENRLLIINLHALGDIVAMTSVLRQYKKDFPGKKIHLLIAEDLNVTKEIFSELVDEILFVDLKKFGSNLLYELKFLNNLRGIGFETVVNQGYGTFEIPGKVISISLGAKKIFGYEGPAIEVTNADWVLEKKIQFVKKSIFPFYTKVVAAIDANFKEKGRVSSFPSIYTEIYKSILSRAPKTLPTKIGIDSVAENSVKNILKKNNLLSYNYAVFVMGGRTPVRWWPVRGFSEVAKEVYHSGVPIILVGTKTEKDLTSQFKAFSNIPVVDLTGELTVSELISIINHCFIVISNDTAPVHLAIALKKPSICIMGTAMFGISDHYGYPGINRWVWEKTNCAFDYWRCVENLKPGESAPCIAAVKPGKVINEFHKLLSLVKRDDYASLLQDDKFEPEFLNMDLLY